MVAPVYSKMFLQRFLFLCFLSIFSTFIKASGLVDVAAAFREAAFFDEESALSAYRRGILAYNYGYNSEPEYPSLVDSLSFTFRQIESDTESQLEPLIEEEERRTLSRIEIQHSALFVQLIIFVTILLCTGVYFEVTREIFKELLIAIIGDLFND